MTNLYKVIEESNSTWDLAKVSNLAELKVNYSKNPPFMEHNEHKFINMASCSYLGLDTHPHILNEAANAIFAAGSLHLTTPRYKMYTSLLGETEELLSEHYQNVAMAFNSCAAATSAFLPLYASGALSSGNKPLMIFDQHAHFSIRHIKPICAAETEIITCQHNDLNFIEDMCKKHMNTVAYIAEGIYSIKGFCPLQDLLMLQEKYGLFLYFDDSHGFSIHGEYGQGYVLNKVNNLNPNTVIVGSLAKAFGVCGGMLLTQSKAIKQQLIRYGNAWSQYINSAGLGGIKASIELHKTMLLNDLQTQWRLNLNYVDSRLSCLANSGTLSPTRIFNTKSKESALEIAKIMLEHGFYVSPVFFPTVSKKEPGIRFMPRADMTEDILCEFCNILEEKMLALNE